MVDRSIPDARLLMDLLADLTGQPIPKDTLDKAANRGWITRRGDGSWHWTKSGHREMRLCVREILEGVRRKVMRGEFRIEQPPE